MPERWILEPGDVLVVPAGRPHRFGDTDRFEWCEVAVCVACVPTGEAASLLEPFERVRAGASAERVGYADPTHFVRTFRREHGTTPAAWRAAQRRASRRRARGRPRHAQRRRGPARTRHG